ncbi:hypothetical protein C8R43DRAFT_528717 [Mycena crocata]|nr:hypothetical protein C8R43DRAFT_528717 [Mycena crocata]
MHLESAKKAFQATLYLRDRLLRVDYAAKFDTRPREPPNNILFLANLPFDTTETEIYAELGLFGPVKDVRFAKRLNRRLGTAHVEYASKKDAIAAYENFAPNDLSIRGRPVRVRYSQRPPPCRRLFFCDYDGDEEALRLLFRDFEPDIQSVKCLRHPVTGESTKNGFVEFGSVERATDAYEELRESKLLKLEYAAHADEKQHRWARRTVHLAERPPPMAGE